MKHLLTETPASPRPAARSLDAAPPFGLRGLTLVELAIVVVILGILAAVVVPSAGPMTQPSQHAAFLRSLRSFVDAAAMYKNKAEEDVPDSPSGVFPPELTGLVRQADFEKPTPLGGSWDVQLDAWGIRSAIGVHFTQGPESIPDDSVMAAIDAAIDDGDLTTGGFQKFQIDRFYYVLQY